MKLTSTKFSNILAWCRKTTSTFIHNIKMPEISANTKRISTRVWEGIIASLPFWICILALALYCFGYIFKGPDNEGYQKLFYSIASAILGGGVFAATLKSVQFLGIFEDILTRIILLKPEWLKSQSIDRLNALWLDVMVASVAKGFPGLSKRLSEDLFEHFIPKMHDFYYSQMRREISLDLYDPATDMTLPPKNVLLS